jgi:hypothetical protein
MYLVPLLLCLLVFSTFSDGIGLDQISNMETVVVRPLGQGNGYKTYMNRYTTTNEANNELKSRMPK